MGNDEALRIEGAEQIAALARRIRTHANPKAVRKELRTGLREAAEPAAMAAKAAALALPSHKSRKMELRGRTAKAISVQVKVNVTHPMVAVRVSRARMGDKAPVPMLMDRGDFRHPVFLGRNGPWARQEGKRNWFEDSVNPFRRLALENINRAGRTIERKISGH